MERVAREAGIPALLEPSIKKALDIEWSDPEAKAEAINTLVEQLDSLETWLRTRLPDEMTKPPLKEHVDTLAQIRSQDLEPDPSGGGGTRIRQGVAPDRRVSIEDAEMRHGRKSKSKLFNGYKRHIATDLTTRLIMACAVTPANRPEEEAAPGLKADVERQQRTIDEMHCDRGYINSPAVAEVIEAGGEVICKPWVLRNGKLFTKADFKLNMRDMTITCPGGAVEQIDLGVDVEFDAEHCAACPLRAECTTAGAGHGRMVTIAKDERLQHKLRKLSRTKRGRDRLRERVEVEHRLSHTSRMQGRRARYRGTRKDLFDVRRAAAVVNLEMVQHRLEISQANKKAA